jgi:hypothetical protein
MGLSHHLRLWLTEFVRPTTTTRKPRYQPNRQRGSLTRKILRHHIFCIDKHQLYWKQNESSFVIRAPTPVIISIVNYFSFFVHQLQSPPTCLSEAPKSNVRSSHLKLNHKSSKIKVCIRSLSTKLAKFSQLSINLKAH